MKKIRILVSLIIFSLWIWIIVSQLININKLEALLEDRTVRIIVNDYPPFTSGVIYGVPDMDTGIMAYNNKFYVFIKDTCLIK